MNSVTVRRYVQEELLFLRRWKNYSWSFQHTETHVSPTCYDITVYLITDIVTWSIYIHVDVNFGII